MFSGINLLYWCLVSFYSYMVKYHKRQMAGTLIKFCCSSERHCLIIISYIFVAILVTMEEKPYRNSYLYLPDALGSL